MIYAVLEGKPGHFTSEGIFDYEPVFAAAKEAGLYVIARPGPYISRSCSEFPLSTRDRVADIAQTPKHPVVVFRDGCNV